MKIYALYRDENLEEICSDLTSAFIAAAHQWPCPAEWTMIYCRGTNTDHRQLKWVSEGKLREPPIGELRIPEMDYTRVTKYRIEEKVMIDQ